VQNVYDCPSVQFDLDPFQTDQPRLAHLYYIRQFSDWEITPDDAWRDASLGRVVVNFTYPARALGLRRPLELWSMDFVTLEDFVSVVEGTAQFQEAMARVPLVTEVYFDPDED
jgi:hypothetical protein